MLTVRDHMTLELAFQRFAYPAVRAERALVELGYTETRYWQRVDFLLGLAEAEVAYPREVRRLRRLRERRAFARSGRPMADSMATL